MSAGARMLLLGASGFVGRHVLAAAREAGLEVVAAARRPAEGVIACDLLDPDQVAERVAGARPELIVNLAGSASVAASWEDPAACFAANAAGALNLLEAASARAPRAHLLCASSAAVYGEPEAGEGPFAEDRPPAPVDPYGAAKLAMEELCGAYARGRALRIAVVRLFNQIGPGQSPDFSVSGFARQIAAAEASGADRVEVALGNPTARRDFLDVRDGAAALLDISRAGLTGTYNLCSGRALAIDELVEAMGAAARVEVTPREDPSLRRPTDPAAVEGDPRRLREAIGRRPAIPLERTIDDLLDWWRDASAGDAISRSPNILRE